MHILTGLLITGLLGKRRMPSLLPLLRAGPVQTAHTMPGRVRFRVPTLQGDAQQGALLQERLSQLEGVQSVAVTAQTGSVLIEYREGRVRAELLFAATVRLLGLDAELARTPRPSVVRELRSLLDSLNRVVYDRTGGLLDFTSAMSILLAAIGIRQMSREGAKALPGGFTLIWWAMHQLFERHQD
jgi:hypothetical protein